MARYSSKKQISEQTRSEASRLAKGTQRPGQTKEQTRLIAQGIERGIDLYKREQKARARALDRRQREKPQQQAPAQHPPDPGAAEPADGPERQQSWLPWLLLALTWAGIGVYWALNAL